MRPQQPRETTGGGLHRTSLFPIRRRDHLCPADYLSMADDDLPPERLASVFANFVQQVASATSPDPSPLLDKIWEHLGTDPAALPVTLEQLDTFEQPNLPLAIDAHVRRARHSADLYGVSMGNKRFMAVGLSELVIRTGDEHRAWLRESPVDYVNYHLADDEVPSCVQFGLYLVRAGDARLAALITGPSEMGDPRRQKLWLEVMATRPDDAAAFMTAIRSLMDELNVYRGPHDDAVGRHAHRSWSTDLGPVPGDPAGQT